MKEERIIQEIMELISDGWSFLCLKAPPEKGRGQTLYERRELSAELLCEFSMKYTVRNITTYGKTFMIVLEESPDFQTNLSWEVIDTILKIPKVQFVSFT